MIWYRYDIYTTTQATDLICSGLEDMGIVGVEIKDNVQLDREELDGMFIDIVPDLPDDDGTAVITFYLEGDENEAENKKIFSEVKNLLNKLSNHVNTGEGRIEVSVTKDSDWANNWKKYWHSFTIGDLLIKPTWEELPKDLDYKKILELDPGTAFGTGTHETTCMVIKAIQKYLKSNDKVLDIGCGSGILSIVSIIYGAKKAFGIDLDKNAITASYSNAKENNISGDRVCFEIGNIISDEEFKKRCGTECYDLIYANILPDVLVPLSGTVTRHLKKGGYLIYSGILDFKENEVRDAMLADETLSETEVMHDGEWVCLIAQKK